MLNLSTVYINHDTENEVTLRHIYTTAYHLKRH